MSIERETSKEWLKAMLGEAEDGLESIIEAVDDYMADTSEIKSPEMPVIAMQIQLNIEALQKSIEKAFEELK